MVQVLLSLPPFYRKGKEGVVTYPDCQKPQLDLNSGLWPLEPQFLSPSCCARVMSLYVFPLPDPENPEGGVLCDLSISLEKVLAQRS